MTKKRKSNKLQKGCQYPLLTPPEMRGSERLPQQFPHVVGADGSDSMALNDWVGGRATSAGWAWGSRQGSVVLLVCRFSWYGAGLQA